MTVEQVCPLLRVYTMTTVTACNHDNVAAYSEFAFTMALTTLSTSVLIADSLTSKEPPLSAHSPK